METEPFPLSNVLRYELVIELERTSPNLCGSLVKDHNFHGVSNTCYVRWYREYLLCYQKYMDIKQIGHRDISSISIKAVIAQDIS